MQLLLKVACLLCAIVSTARASSTRPEPLPASALAHPDQVEFRLLRARGTTPNKKRGEVVATPRWDDTFMLSFNSGHHQDGKLTLSLRPARSLLHPKGVRITETHTSYDGEQTVQSYVLGRDKVRAYEGWVLDESIDLAQWEAEELAGIVRPDYEDNWARIVLSEENPDEFAGSFMHRGELFTIHSTPNYLRSRSLADPDPPLIQKRGVTDFAPMVIVREAHSAASSNDDDAAQCGHESLPFNVDPLNPVFNIADVPWSPNSFDLSANHLFGRQTGGDIGGGGGQTSNFINSIGSTAGCPKQPMVVYVGVAADCTYTSAYSTSDAARQQILTIFNSASALYQTSFNVSLGIVELNVQSGACPTSSSQVDSQNPWNVGCEEGGPPGLSLNDRLSVFSQWRGQKGGGDSAGLWHLMTNCSTGSEVGVAWLGQLCRVNAITSDGQTTSGTGVTAITRNEWQVVAHEIGHNFGAIHDCASGCSLSGACCPLSSSQCNANAAYIMSPVSARNTSNFSPCSIGNICTTLSSSLNTTCLARPGAANSPRIISLQSCGNGIVEEGEDCDPPPGSNSSCCDTSTCKFRSGAVCDPTNSLCCTSQCQLSGSGTVCRAKVDETCDKEEVCSGTSAECPTDEYTSDGTGCGNGLSCASGVCTSRDQQCQNSGSSLGLTQGCSPRANTGCSIACQDPSSANTCVVLEQSFRDGTSCGYGGRCKAGDCVSGSALDTAKSWYTQNLQISIPVTIVVGIIVLLIIFAIARCCWRRSKGVPATSGAGKLGRRNNRAPSARYSHSVRPPQMQASYGHGQPQYAPPPMPPPVHPSRNGGWVDPSGYNGPHYR